MTHRGKLIEANRVTLPREFIKERDLKSGDFCEIEDYTRDPEHPKVLITFFKVGNR